MAADTTVRVARSTRKALKDLAQQRGVTIDGLLSELVDRARGEALLAQHDHAMARLRGTSRGEELAAEDAAWDATLGDGLQGELAPRRR